MLLTEFTGSSEAIIEAEPTAVFAALTDVDRLPEWNKRIANILEPPPGPLAPGVEWVLKMSVPPATWPSRARVVSYDPDRLEFEHISNSDDGNPSYAVWKWLVVPVPRGARVVVEWAVHPKTFWRRLLFARLRRKQLAEEVPASLAALKSHLAARDAAV